MLLSGTLVKIMQDKWIFLYGPPSSGKSAIGRQLAEALGLPFVDLDEQVEKDGGAAIPMLFASLGEAGFRRIEIQTLKRLLAEPVGVMALGGGSLLDEANRKHVENCGRVICLSAGRPALLERLNQSAAVRPLLEGDLEQKLVALLQQRATHYASFPTQVSTDNLSLAESVWQVQVQLGRFRVSGMGETYNVQVSAGSLDEVGEVLSSYLNSTSFVVVADTRVTRLYAARALGSLSAAGLQVNQLAIPSGESHKSIRTMQRLWAGFIEAGLDRRGTIIALGGGVTTDMVGFAAATYLRGVAWVAIPTTLLAMVDAALGGKTGANLGNGKNLVGAFYPPRLVLVDPQVLASLPVRQVGSGMAEVVKAGIIGDPHLFETCGHGLASLEGRWTEIIQLAMAVKLRLVKLDPYEKGPREALNLGHTVGHALERLTNFRLSHGEAVAIGMVAEARLAEQIGMGVGGLAGQISSVLANLGLPVDIPAGISTEDMLAAMQVDKKRQAGNLRFSLPVAIGDVRTGIPIKPAEVISILNKKEVQI